MKSFFFTFILLTLSFYGSAQSVFNTGGSAPTSVTQKTISSNFGEPITSTAKDDEEDYFITQGVLQPDSSENVNTGINAFSPNGDGTNDMWKFSSKGNPKGYTVEIFSRWGNTVWDNKDQINAFEWNGKDYNEDDVPDGTYFYILTLNGKTVDKSFIEITR